MTTEQFELAKSISERIKEIDELLIVLKADHGKFYITERSFNSHNAANIDTLAVVLIRALNDEKCRLEKEFDVL